MRDLSASLKSHLAGPATTLTHCWKITRADGVVLGFTDHDRSLMADDTLFVPQDSGDLTAIDQSADLSVDNASLDAVLSSDKISADDLRSGRFDGARIDIYRVNWQDPTQFLLLKTGTFGDVVRSRDGFRVEIRGLTHALDRPVGRVYQYQCDARLGDERCGVDLNDPAYWREGVIDVGSSRQSLRLPGISGAPEGFFTHGVARFLSGELAGLTRSIRAHRAAPQTVIDLWTPLPEVPPAGAALRVTAGCDRLPETCRTKFQNYLNFRGFPHMPGNDFVTLYPLRGENHDGGRR